MTESKSALGQGVVADDIPTAESSHVKNAQPAFAPRLMRFFAATAFGVIFGFGAWALSLPDTPPAEIATDHQAGPTPNQVLAQSTKPLGPDLPDEIRSAPISQAIAAADEILLVGDFASARTAYEQLKLRAAGDDAKRIAYRIGVAAELSGDLEEARRTYQSLVEDAQGSGISRAARLGQARLAIVNGRFRAAQSQLSAELLANGMPGQSNEWSAEAAHLLAQCQAREVLLSAHQDLLEDQSAMVPPLALEATQLLRLGDTQVPREDPQEDRAGQGVSVVHRFGPEPEKTQVAVTLIEEPLPEALSRLACDSGLRVVTSEFAKQIMHGRSTTIRQANASLALIFDRLLIPLGLCWRLDHQLVRVSRMDEMNKPELIALLQNAATRASRQASFVYPDHCLASFAEFSLAMIQFQRDELDESLQNYAAFLTRNPRSLVRQTAWFNLAKAQLATGDEPAAITSFYHVIDYGRELEIAHASYLYVGRLLIELGQYDAATRPLLMAITLSTSSRIRELSIVALASSYTLDNNYSAAAAVLAEYSRDIKSPAVRQTAELVSQYVRFCAADKARVDHAGANVVGALANPTHDGFLRVADGLIRNEALRDLGLLKQRAEFLKEFLETASRGSARHRISLALADSLGDLGEFSESERWLEKIVQEAKEPWSTMARKRQIQIARITGDAARCLETCATLIASTDEKHVHEFALGVMGRIYQSRGDYRAASLCYAGILPPSVTASGLRPSAEQQGSETRQETE